MQGGVGHVLPYEQQVMLSRLQGAVPPDQILETMYGGGINQAALLQARHGLYAQQVITPFLVHHLYPEVFMGAHYDTFGCSDQMVIRDEQTMTHLPVCAGPRTGHDAGSDATRRPGNVPGEGYEQQHGHH